jgi:hypothetical protein
MLAMQIRITNTFLNDLKFSIVFSVNRDARLNSRLSKNNYFEENGPTGCLYFQKIYTMSAFDEKFLESVCNLQNISEPPIAYINLLN